jgi:hypothetical protein
METRVSSPSFAEPLGIWAASRMPLLRFGAAAALLVAGAAAGGRPSLPWMLGASAAALLLLFQFRLWDDLADAPRDRLEHPERYLPRCDSTAVFRAAVWIAAGINLAAIAFLTGGAAAIALLMLNVFFIAWYRRNTEARTNASGTLVLLLKYPVFTALLAPPPLDAVALALACAAVYAALCCYEFISRRTAA